MSEFGRKVCGVYANTRFDEKTSSPEEVIMCKAYDSDRYEITEI